MANQLKCNPRVFGTTNANISRLFTGSINSFQTDRWGVASAAFRLGSTNMALTFTLSAPASGITAGSAVRVNTLGVGISRFEDGVTTHLLFSLGSAGALEVYRGNGTTLLASSDSGLGVVNAWNYIERQAVIADAGGTAEVRLNNETVLSFTGDTRNGAAAQITHEEIIGTLGTTEDYCDWYINDNTGGVDDDFWGDTRMYVLLPTGAGDVDQWTPTGAATNWEAVDNIPVNTAIFSSDDTPGDEVRFTIEALPSVTTVLGVDVWSLLDKDDAGARTAAPEMNSNGTIVVSSDEALSAGSPFYRRLSQRLNPDGGVAWATATVNAMMPGTKVTS